MSAPTDQIALLREAARLLQEYAAAATPGPWTSGAARHADCVVIQGPDVHLIADVMRPDSDDTRLAVARWIVLMSPAIAGPLANWLEVTAELIELDRSPGSARNTACAVARAIIEAGQR